MIPFAPGFFKPQVAAADITCEDTYGETFYAVFFDSFNTAGALNGASDETSDWTYASVSATRSGGVVSPATFTASGSQLATNKVLVSVNMASGETLTMDFLGADYTIQVKLTLGAGEACEFSIIWTGDSAETITDTFSIGATAGEVTVGFDAFSTFNNPNTEMYLYVGPDFVTTPAATLVQVINSFPTPYTQLGSLEFACTGSNTSVDFIRICSDLQG